MINFLISLIVFLGCVLIRLAPLPSPGEWTVWGLSAVHTYTQIVHLTTNESGKKLYFVYNSCEGSMLDRDGMEKYVVLTV